MCQNLEYEEGIIDDAFYRANGPFNPEVAPLSGHKPMGWSQMAAIYNHVSCIEAKFTATFSSKSDNSATAHSIVGLRLDADVVMTSPNTTALCEQPGTMWKPLSPGDASTGLVTMTKKFNAKRFFGVSDVNGAAGLKSTVVALPAELAYFHLFVRRADDAVAFAPVLLQGFITYKLKWSEPKEMVASA